LISAGSSGTPVYKSEQDDILAANAAYYEAFASADFGKMSHIWADDEVTCVHRGWPVLIGGLRRTDRWQRPCACRNKLGSNASMVLGG
jgi:hypothetical protein